MDFINIETQKITQYNFKIFDTNAIEYFENEVNFTYEFQRFEGSLDYTLTIIFNPIQSKKGQGASISVKTIFSFTASESIPKPLSEPAIKRVSDLLNTAWSYTTVLFNLMCYKSVFEDNFLSKRFIGDWYAHLIDSQNRT